MLLTQPFCILESFCMFGALRTTTDDDDEEDDDDKNNNSKLIHAFSDLTMLQFTIFQFCHDVIFYFQYGVQ